MPRWSSSGLGAGGPPPGLGAGGPPLGGPPAGPVAGLPPWRRGRTSARSSVLRVSMVLPDCTVSIAAARPIFAASRVAPRPTAPTATPAMVTPAMAMAVATGTGLCGGGCGLRLWQILCLLRGRLLLRVHIQAIRHQARSGLSWKLIETTAHGAPVLHRGACLLAERNLPVRADFGLDSPVNKLYGIV